jgi:NAD(P)-dependent dehydrogenase (short-subunit alcohol dehydrogenase family)
MQERCWRHEVCSQNARAVARGSNRLLVEDKVAVVTGAASGIGRATVDLFLREGARVVALDRRAAVPDHSLDPTLSIVCDVSNAGQVESFVRQLRERLGRCDILVNSAGTVVVGKAGDCSEEEWDRAFDVNAKGSWLMCRAVLPLMVEQQSGAIVNVASGAGLRAVPRLSAYSASKAAVVGLTRSIALDYGTYGIRANCICPGMIDTPMNEETLEQLSAQEREAAQGLEPYAIKRRGRPEEIAAAALFLSSPEVTYLTGAALPVDGGRTMH